MSVAPLTLASNSVARPYTADEVAELLRVTRRTVMTLAALGSLPSVRVGKSYRFPQAAIDALAEGK